MKRYLIINADDYGSYHAANEAIERLFRQGFVTSTTLMTPCPWAEDAVLRALDNPAMKVGLHITTTCEYDNYKWGPIDRSCTSLMDARGYFHRTTKENLAAATQEDMTKEIQAQYDWMVSHGLPPDHIDSHMGTVYGIDGPPYLMQVFKLCAANGLNFRLPKKLKYLYPQADESLVKSLDAVTAIAEKMHIGLPVGLFTCPYKIDSDETYAHFKAYYLGLIEQCPEGVSELFLHPCIETEEIKAINPHWQKRVWEYDLLHDDEVLRFIQNQGIELCSYGTAPFFE